ncbi:hypothetical protein PG984_010139 [Apiospora sp. TS-2023a]
MKQRSGTSVSGKRAEPQETPNGTNSQNKSRRKGQYGRVSPCQPTPQPAILPSEDVDLDPYVYRPLDVSKNEIRLMTLLPGEFDSPIQITLQHISLDHLPPQPRPIVMSLKDVRATLPQGWSAYQTLHGRIMFSNWDRHEYMWIKTWKHPNAHISQTAYDITMHTPPSKKDMPSFEALSYAWGSLNLTARVVAYDRFEEPTAPQPALVIESERRKLRIGENLHEALLYLRLPDEPRVLWIDALCINQDNFEERGHQVACMAHIYSRARKVIAWLGPEYDNAAKALQGLAQIGNQVEILDGHLLGPTPGASEPSWWDHTVPLPFDDSFWAAVYASAQEQPSGVRQMVGSDSWKQ